MSKKITVLFLTVLLSCSLAGCGTDKTTLRSGDELTDAKPYKAALLVNGTLGDKSFFDSACQGLQSLEEELGADRFTFKVEQMGGTASDEAKWEPTLYDYCEDGSYDILIMGTFYMTEPLANACKDYPDQHFIIFDQQFDFDELGGQKNVYNILYKQNEIAYLVGAAAAMMTTDDTLEYVNPSDRIIGFLGGQDNSVIRDFLVGYIQGALDVDPDIQVAMAYVGNFYDSASAKDMALTQYQNGADVGFNVAGSAGLGQIAAAAQAQKYAFGVDSDQAALLPQYASYIPTSAIKNVGNSLIRAIKLDLNGQLSYGLSESLGFSQGGIELLEDEHYQNMVPEKIRDQLTEIKEQIINGEIQVPTTTGPDALTPEELQTLIDSVQIRQT